MKRKGLCRCFYLQKGGTSGPLRHHTSYVCTPMPCRLQSSAVVRLFCGIERGCRVSMKVISQLHQFFFDISAVVNKTRPEHHSSISVLSLCLIAQEVHQSGLWLIVHVRGESCLHWLTDCLCGTWLSSESCCCLKQQQDGFCLTPSRV